MQYVTRKEWGARSPKSRIIVPRQNRIGVMWHYSGASPDQTPRIIQDYHMNTRGWDDIGYNWLISSKTGTIYEGRGWDILGAHCAGWNTPFVGVCIIGNDKVGRKDVSDAAFYSAGILYEEARDHFGKNLSYIGHRDKAATECPGNEIDAWIRAGMPGHKPTPAPAPARDWTEETIMALPQIKQGATGAHVRTAQALATARGHTTAIDGDFGPKTKAATEAMQRAYGAEEVDGIWGPETWTIGITGKDTR